MFFKTEGTVFAPFKTLAAELNAAKGDITIYGFGANAERVIPVLISKGFRIKTILDQNPALKGKTFYGAPVLLPEEYADKNTPIAVSVDFVLWNLIKKFKERGFTKILPVYFFLFDQEIDADNSIYYDIQSFQYELFRSRKTQASLFSIDIPVTMRCSLRCRDCANLMQYFLHPKHTDFEQMKKSVDKLFNVIDFTFDVRILGGEPFVNTELYKFIELFERYDSRYAYIWILTNGTIIPNARTLQALKNPYVYVRISNYHNPKQKIKELIDVFDKAGVFYEVLEVKNWQDCARIKNYHRSPAEIESMLKNCNVHITPVIVDGKIFRCPFSGNAWLLSAMPPEYHEYVELLNTNDNDAELRNKIRSLMEAKHPKACNFCGNRNFTGNWIEPAIQTEKTLEYRNYAG
jgi:organic radical activating enzyme